MSNPSRRVPPPSHQSQYNAVPQSPQTGGRASSRPVRSASNNSQNMPMPAGRNDMAQGVASGAIGAGYGPYAHNGGGQNYTAYTASRFSAAPSEVSSATGGDKPQPTSSTTPPYMWDVKDPDLDDALHNPDPRIDAAQDRSFTIFSARGWANVSVLVVLVAGLLTLFAGYPIIAFVRSTPLQSLGANFGGSNKTGQIPELVQLPQLIDPATESQFYSKTGSDGRTWNLVFSDEFNTDGRTFWPGDDPFWEAVDLHYWPTGDLEWYNPQAITTKGGKLVITMTEQDNHNLNFQSGMLQSWNKFCFTTGIVEVSVSLPGSPQAPGFWPGVWSMGNLGRAGYGATTEGTWPYSYAACDTGTFINQTDAQGQPSQALTGAPGGGQLSLLPGQRLSACTCPGSEHPGPNVNVGRNVPEIDILEAQIDVSIFRGEASQSFQVAPFNYLYQFDNSSTSTPISDPTLTKFNTYKGDLYQQAISAVTYLDNQNYGGNGYAPYAYEWWSDPKNRDDGYIQWYVDGQPTWKLTSATLAGDSETKISSRIVPEEPMYIILNFGMAPSFQHQDFEHLVFPSEMLIDYVRVYQREDVSQGVGCDPSSRPTADYITKHMNAYTNPNLTTWASAGYQFPRNSLYDGC